MAVQKYIASYELWVVIAIAINYIAINYIAINYIAIQLHYLQ